MENLQPTIRVGITHGDYNGIGYEVIIKTLDDIRINDLCIPIVYGSAKVAAYHRKAININNFNFNHIKSAEQANNKRSNIINCIDDNNKVELGSASKAAGLGAFRALEKAVEDLKDNKIDVLITAPINKNTINSKQFEFPGHTEYLKERFGVEEVLMLMVGENIKIGVVAGHVPIKEVSAQITEENILKKLRLMNKSLLQDFGLRKPKIAVLGLNPHAGDEGLLGTEEQEIIIPAINKAREENIMAVGPYPADGFFGANSHTKFDAILAMYHDQGLVPFKLLEFEKGVNFTAGLPIVRTSPAHGTAYGITGQGIASEESFRNALYLALEIYKNRELYNEMTSNQLDSEDSE
jgi:4-hydroxythreonine-4-phosphate dehydrogenase